MRRPTLALLASLLALGPACATDPADDQADSAATGLVGGGDDDDDDGDDDDDDDDGNTGDGDGDGDDAPADTGSGPGGTTAPDPDSGPDPATSSMDDSSGDDTTTGTPRLGKFVGNITTNGMVREDFIDYWNQITPENEGKWGSVEPVRDQMNWGPLDAVYDYAMEHDIPFKQHTMVWGSQQPGWIGGLSQGEQLAEVEEWIQLFCERYPNTAIIDVVNEPPPHTTPPYMNAIGGSGASGYDWIIWAFQTTRMYCPDAILVLNDYNVLRWQTQHYVDIVNAVKGSGYIDAMGAQSHGLETIAFSELEDNLALVLSTGLPLYITEYDIDIANDQQQADIMAQQFPLFWDTEEIAGITLWGYVYGSTWLPNTGLLVNENPRPALTWLMDYLDQQ